MKKKVFLLLFLAVTSLISSQDNNNKLHEVFDSEAFEISIPDSWREVEPYYPFKRVKQFVLKDTLSKGYFTIGQFEIKKPNNFKLNSVVNTRLDNLKKARYKKFNSTIEENGENHFVLNASWRSWDNKKVTLKHTTEYLQKENIIYVFRYSDSTFSNSNFKSDVKKMVSSFKVNRKAKNLLDKKAIPNSQLKDYLKEYTLTVPVNWYGFIDETGALQFAPYELYFKKYTRNRNVFFVKNYTDNENYENTLTKFAQQRFNKINSFYRIQKTIKRKEVHKKYGNYFLIQYSNRVRILNENQLSSTKATVVEAIIVYNKKKFILTYYFENRYFNTYVKQINETINSFEIKEPN